MERTADAVVIGGGIMGASVAHFLAKKRFGKVVLLEKQTLAAVSTGNSAAVIRTFYSNDLTIQLVMRAVEMFENDQEELGGDCDFRQVGWLGLMDEESATAGRAVLSVETEHQTGAREVDLGEVAVLVPQLDLKDVVYAVHQPRGGYADPVKTTRAVADGAKDWGLTVYEGVAATGIQMEGNQVSGVQTEEGVIETNTVVNAAGPWGRQVGEWVGKNYSIRWSRETDLVLRLPTDFGSFPVVSDMQQRVYFRPEGNDKVVAGLSFPKEVEPMDIEVYDRHLDAESRHRIQKGLFLRVPALPSADLVHGWGSIYTITDDWHPLVGPEPDVDGYYACFGGSGHCFKLGPPLGEALADVIAGGTPKIDIRPLRPNRFAEGEVFTSAWGGGNKA